jgi:hypothetical protein
LASKKLSHELLNLDIDEVLRIESIKSGKKIKMYLNKRTSSCYVAEICSYLTDESEIIFYTNIKRVHKLIDKIFGKEYSVTVY